MGKYKLYDCERDTALEMELTASQFEELKRFLKELKSPPNMDYRLIFEQYNSICCSMTPAKNLTNKRKRAIYRLVKSGYDPIELFRIAAQIPFLCGINKEGWRANFDWLIEPENAIKVIEGNYSKRSAPPSAPMSGNPFDEYG